MREFITFDEAQRLVLGVVTPQKPESVALHASGGRILADRVLCADPIPPFDNSAMDGYAVRSDDVTQSPIDLLVTADIPAGVFPSTPVEPGCCARIMTGAPMPDGADAVVPVESTGGFVEVGRRVAILKAYGPGAHVRRSGEDLRTGQEVLPSGTRITPPVMGILASVGEINPTVSCRPRVSIVVTGDELVDASSDPGPGQIRNSNGPALAAQTAAAGAQVVGPFHARDSRKSIRTELERALDADVVVISGGVSVGSYDLVKEELGNLGLDLLFWKVRQRPGKPLAFGVLEGRLIFGLPGNPVSSSVCFEQYVRPALLKMMGHAEPVRARWTARLSETIHTPENLHVFARGIARPDGDGRLGVSSTGPQGSHVFSSMVAANCLIHLPAGTADFSSGSLVEIEWIAW